MQVSEKILKFMFYEKATKFVKYLPNFNGLSNKACTEADCLRKESAQI